MKVLVWLLSHACNVTSRFYLSAVFDIEKMRKARRIHEHARAHYVPVSVEDWRKINSPEYAEVESKVVGEELRITIRPLKLS